MDNILTEKERLVLRKRFKDRETLEIVGKFFGVTRERVRQIEAKAVEKLREINPELDKDLRGNIIKILENNGTK